jgi:hypothetical protein
MAADATAGRFRPAAPATVNILGVAAAGLTVTMFAACGVLLLLTRDYQRAVYGAGGCVAALVCLAVGLVVARRQPASPIGWLLLGWADAFAARLQDAVDLGTVRDELASAVHAAFEPAHLSIWIREP